MSDISLHHYAKPKMERKLRKLPEDEFKRNTNKISAAVLRGVSKTSCVYLHACSLREILCVLRSLLSSYVFIIYKKKKQTSRLSFLFFAREVNEKEGVFLMYILSRI